LYAEATGFADGRGWRRHHGYGYGGNGYVVGLPIPSEAAVVAAPGFIYGSYFGRPVYLFAPSAKIITLE